MLKQPSQHIQLVLRGGPGINIDTFNDQCRCLKPISCPKELAGQIDAIIGAGKIKLLANPKKMPSMTGFNLDIVGYLDNKDL